MFSALWKGRKLNYVIGGNAWILALRMRTDPGKETMMAV
jgi:hypothetical protein